MNGVHPSLAANYYYITLNYLRDHFIFRKCPLTSILEAINLCSAQHTCIQVCRGHRRRGQADSGARALHTAACLPAGYGDTRALPLDEKGKTEDPLTKSMPPKGVVRSLKVDDRYHVNNSADR